MEKSSSTKPVPGAKKLGTAALRGPWGELEEDLRISMISVFGCLFLGWDCTWLSLSLKIHRFSTVSVISLIFKVFFFSHPVLNFQKLRCFFQSVETCCIGFFPDKSVLPLTIDSDLELRKFDFFIYILTERPLILKDHCPNPTGIFFQFKFHFFPLCSFSLHRKSRTGIIRQNNSYSTMGLSYMVYL